MLHLQAETGDPRGVPQGTEDNVVFLYGLWEVLPHREEYDHAPEDTQPKDIPVSRLQKDIRTDLLPGLTYERPQGRPSKWPGG